MKSRPTPFSAALTLTAFAAFVHHLSLGLPPTLIRHTSRSMRLTRPIQLLISRLHRLLARSERKCPRWISRSWDTPTNASIPSAPDNSQKSARGGGVDDVRNNYLHDDYLSARYLTCFSDAHYLVSRFALMAKRKAFTVTPASCCPTVAFYCPVCVYDGLTSIFRISSVLTRLYDTPFGLVIRKALK